MTARLHDPDTSHAAGQRTNKPRGKDKVYAALQAAPDGLTDEQLARATRMHQGSAAKRRGELVEDGLVVATPDRRLSEFGCSMIVWEAL